MNLREPVPYSCAPHRLSRRRPSRTSVTSPRHRGGPTSTTWSAGTCRSSATSSARRMSRVPAHVNRDDLTSAGMLALVQAAQLLRRRPAALPFATYASTRIRGAIVDELRGLDWASRSVRRRARQVDDTRGRIADRPSAARPSDHEVAAAPRHRRPASWPRTARTSPAPSVVSLQGFDDDGVDDLLPAHTLDPRRRARAARADRLPARRGRAPARAAARRRRGLLLRRAADGRDRRRARRHRVPDLPAARRGARAAARRHEPARSSPTWPSRTSARGLRRPPAGGVLRQRRRTPHASRPGSTHDARSTGRTPPDDARRKLSRTPQFASAPAEVHSHRRPTDGPHRTHIQGGNIMSLRINQNIAAHERVPQPVGHRRPDVQVAGEAVQRFPHQPRRRRRGRPRDLRGPALAGRWPQGRRPQRPGRHQRRADR